ncbi:MAG: sensor histidine kinase [Acidobacteria bacterium]|nr:sensor histidine kinase [Acidobacteriota bacterium]
MSVSWLQPPSDLDSMGTAEKDRLVRALRGRVKALRVLQDMARLLQNGPRDVRLLLHEAVRLIPAAWQYPGVAAARIAVGDAEAAGPGFERTPWMQTAVFAARHGGDGIVEVAYLVEKPRSHEGPFLEEEWVLIQSLAQMLEAHFERRAAEDDLERQVRERAAELARANAARRRLASELALTEERHRRAIASDLHDHIGQALAVAKGRLAGLRGNAVFSGMERDFEEIDTLLGQTIQYTRTLTFEISPPVVYELGLEAALRWLAKEFRHRHGLRSEVVVSGQGREVPDDLRITLFRSVQELMMNAVKHARADLVQIRLDSSEERLTVEVRDDGVGFDSAQVRETEHDGFGLFSIRERMEGLGGSLTIDSAPGGGAALTLSVPFPARKGEPL